MRVVPGIALDQFYLGAGEGERSVSVRNVHVSCTGLWVQGVLVWSRTGPCRGVPGSTRQEGFNWGHRSVL